MLVSQSKIQQHDVNRAACEIFWASFTHSTWVNSKAHQLELMNISGSGVPHHCHLRLEELSWLLFPCTTPSCDGRCCQEIRRSGCSILASPDTPVEIPPDNAAADNSSSFFITVRHFNIVPVRHTFLGVVGRCSCVWVYSNPSLFCGMSSTDERSGSWVNRSKPG